MTKSEIYEIIKNGENSGVEFKQEEIKPLNLAEEIVSFANFKGGIILLGVKDDKAIIGIKRDDLEEWVMNICRDIVKPGIIPYYEEIELDEGKVGVIKVDEGEAKPYYYVEDKNRKKYLIRVGSTNREASREELARLFQASGLIHYDMAYVPKTSIDDLNLEKLKEYFLQIRGIDIDTSKEYLPQLLVNSSLMTKTNTTTFLTVAGVLLFGKFPQKFMPQATITAVKFSGIQMDYDTEDRKEIKGTLQEQVDEAIAFVKRNTKTSSIMKGIQRTDKDEYPTSVIREAVVNAVIHRNYSIAGSPIRLFIFKDRLELKSPGRLPNTIDLEKIKIGCSYYKNPILVEFMQHYGYVEKMGLGIPIKIIKGMLDHNGKMPKFEEINEEFWVTLYS
ncbi:MAG: RNA-binding domain-containing protein [bacterium]